ncbi:hypothetical protein B0H13DRAFT_755490 [Mycena leptocephala]|nr:hypothetical protein B0H13DRAFT_755490 [Mycena leptocephala]
MGAGEYLRGWMSICLLDSAGTCSFMCLLSLCVVSPVRPEVRFVEPVTDVLHQDVRVESLADDREHDDALLMTVGGEDPYRPSPASPSPRRRRTRSLMSRSTFHRVFTLRRRWRPYVTSPTCHQHRVRRRYHR